MAFEKTADRRSHDYISLVQAGKARGHGSTRNLIAVA
jgi:hypothetical protein